MIALSGVALGRVYAGTLLTQLVAGAAAGSVLISVAARRLPSWLVAPLSAVALAGYAALAMWLAAGRAQLTDPFGDVVVDATRNGIPRLLTAMIPVEPTPDTVLVPVVAAWLAGLAGAEVILRANRVLLGYLPPAVLFAGALYVVGPNADPALWPAVAFAAAAAVGLASTTRRPAAVTTPAGTGPAGTDGLPAAARLRLLAATAIGLTLVIAATAVVAPVVARQVSSRPVDPRRYVQPPQVDSLDENPLIRISGWALNPNQELFQVRTTGRSGTGAGAAGPSANPDGGTGDGNLDGGTGDGTDDGADDDGQDGAPPPDAAEADKGVRIRLAVLNDYDGATWRVGATYRNAGRILPSAPVNPDSSVEHIRQEITIEELSGRLLPAVATPEEVTGARIAYDPGSGTLIRPEGLAAGVRYTVSSAQEKPDLNLLATANVPAGDKVARVLRVADGAPEQIQRLAEQLAADNGAPYARALAIEEFLSEHYRIVADAPSGHAYPNLNFFLFGPRNGGGQRGTSEQFAATFAVLGRLMGLPTRVVVGFESRTGDGPVRAADAFAWPEVLFDGLGWVAFDPLPRPNTQPRPVEEDFKPKPDDPPPSPDEQTPSATPAASASAQAAPAPRGRGGLSGPVLAGGGSGLLLLLLGGLVLAVTGLRRAQRRRRLDDGPPGQRIVGAWWEVTDALRLAGRPAAEHLAASEVAEHAREVGAEPVKPPRPPVPPIDDLASLVNLATFAPGGTDEEQARRAGSQAVAYATALRARRSWWRRLVWSLHPGPLRWRR
ncbi:transglutaminaseTgpA domain-containing protein [Micromonospora sp. NPDC049559]|uniref:DUF3488 and transglutaminase-like domain-containing protein n=1 Tax=Micromonospora sp. NPDC049559 TaxID=3155923 RepID=UPI003420853D